MRKVDGVERSLESKYAAMLEKWRDETKREKDRFGVVVKKLNYLSAKFDSVCEEEAIQELEEIVALPSIRRQSRILQPSGEAVFGYNKLYSLPPGEEEKKRSEAVTKAVAEMKDTVEGMDRRLAFHINIVAENLGEMNNMVEDVHVAIVGEEPRSRTFGKKKAYNQTNANNKIDRLLEAVQPLENVRRLMTTY